MNLLLDLDTPLAQSYDPLFRYPGGKSKVRDLIISYFPKDLKEMVSPFIGGGSIELLCASRGIKVYAGDVFEPLVNFYINIKKRPQEVAERIAVNYPISKKKYRSLEKSFKDLDDPIERAAIFYVLARDSFSGKVFSGMCSKPKRFTSATVKSLRMFRADNLDVRLSDFKDTLARHPNLFAYMDPPYALGEASVLYGVRGSTHRDFDHEGLAEVLLRRKNWILSYNDCDWVRDTYKRYEILTPRWRYSFSPVKGKDKSKEVLILNVSQENPL